MKRRRALDAVAVGSTPRKHPSPSPTTKKLRDPAWAPSVGAAFVLLLIARILGAAFNIILDCDEVYNYWEPLHYLLYGYGMQTWEYSSAYALRSYLYLILHALIAFPAKLILGSSTGKVYVFYTVRAALGIISSGLEATLYRCVLQKSAGTAVSFFLFLLFSSGMFLSSNTLLPSTFTMYAMMASTIGVLQNQTQVTIVSAVVGVVLGWPVAGIAFVPYALYVLLQPHLVASFGTGAAALALTVVPLLGVDHYFYGKLTVSLWNFILYNVAGGGQSALYGVEGPFFYVKNGINNFNVSLVLAFLLPVVILGHWLWPHLRLMDGKEGSDENKCRWLPSLLLACSPLYLWFFAISMLPHKEERFLYVVYPQICLAAAVSLEAVVATANRLLHARPSSLSLLHARFTELIIFLSKWAVLLAYSLVSIARTVAILWHYGAPLIVYRSLPRLPDDLGTGHRAPVQVCVGREWHRFPSAFFLPSNHYRLAFVDSGFRGLLPAPFNPRAGGTSAAPAVLNNENRHEPLLYVEDVKDCKYLVDFEMPKSDSLRSLHPDILWEVVASEDFVEASLSPALTRALYIPLVSKRMNAVGKYMLLWQVTGSATD